MAALPVALPVLAAGILIALGNRGPRRAAEGVATATAAVVTALAVAMILRSSHGTVVTWFGHWTPRQGIAPGVSFVVDPLGAGLAATIGLLTTAALVFGWRFFDEVRPLYPALVLLFLAGMTGFALSGDLFNMLVFFELMGVAAYALTGYEVEDPGPIQGSLNFAVTNSIGAFAVLWGVALLYGRTGALNLAQIGDALARGRADGLVVVALALVSTGFLVKAAAVPFHFWLADAHAVAPSPVCTLFSGVMVELGLYGVARVYWTAFSAAVPPPRLRAPLIALGLLTAVVGAVLCLAQHDFKRLLAYSTISHSGMFLAGIGALDAAGLHGASVWILGHALVKGSLFLTAGTILNQLGGVSERELHGRGRAFPVTGAMVVAGALALAGLPPFASSLGKALTEEAVGRVTSAGLTAVFVAASAATGAAVLRFAAHAFLGWGRPPGEDPSSGEAEEEQHPEEQQPSSGAPLVLTAPPASLLALALALGIVPGLSRAVAGGADRFVAGSAYRAVVLGGTAAPVAHGPAAGWSIAGVLLGLLSAALAVGLAASSVFSERVPALVRRLVGWVTGPPLRVLRAVHSGHIGDDIAWFTLGLAAVGAAFAFQLR